MIERTGEVVIRMLANVQRATIAPLIRGAIATGSVVYTAEYDIHNRLSEWGYTHRTVCHARGEYAGDDDGDGFCEVHVNTLEGFWSLLRSWLRPHRGSGRSACRCTWGSSSSCTTSGPAARACWGR
jgi:transposase